MDVLTKDQRQQAIKDLIDFFATEMEQEIGVIAAEDILNFILQSISPAVYNKGVDDAKKVFDERLANLALDITVLKKEL